MQKLLNNSVFQLLLVILVVGGVVAATQLIPSGDDGQDLPIGTTTQENFQKFTGDIQHLSKAAWDKEAYKSIQRDIDRYASNTPEPLLDPSQRKTLLANLTQAYVVTLNKATWQFCEQGSDYKQLLALEKEAKQHPGIKAQGLIAKYHKALSLVNQIAGYTSSQPHIEARYNALYLDIKDYPNMRYFKKNTFLQKKVNYSIERLNDHKSASFDFQRCKARGGEKYCKCNQYKAKGFNYYVCQCQKKLCEDKADYEFNPKTCKCEEKDIKN